MPQYRVTDTEDGREVVAADSIEDSRGEAWIFESVERGPMPGKTAKILASQPGKTPRTFYASVFGLTVEEVK